MATATKKRNKTMIENVALSGLSMATKANDFALTTTEKAFTTSFKMTEKCMGATHKVVKKGLSVSAMQQDMFFDVLTGIKKKVLKK